MTTSEITINERIIWNSSSLKQIDEAKKLYLKWKNKGYKIEDTAGNVVKRFKPAYEELIVLAQKMTKKFMVILCEKGDDDTIVWDKENGKEAKEAKAEFVKLMDKGYKAYSINRRSGKKTRIYEFDVDLEEILMVPKTVRG